MPRRVGLVKKEVVGSNSAKGELLGVPQPRVSELTNGKISRMTADLLAKYLHRLGREVSMKGKPNCGGAAVVA